MPVRFGKKKRKLTTTSLLVRSGVDPQRQDGVDGPRREENHIVMHAVMSLCALGLDPLPDLPRQVGHIHLNQLAVVAVLVDARPRAGVQLLVVEDLEFGRKRLEVWVHLAELVDGGLVGG